MAYNTRAIKIDKDGKPIPQVFNPTADEYEVLKGDAGAARQVLYDKDGNVVSVVSGKLAVRAAELESALGNILSKIISAPATEAKQNSLETVLKAIRDSAGIKKITDALPAGTNKIGKVDVDSSALPTGAATEAMQDSIHGLLISVLQQMLTGDNFDAKADIKMSALRDAITAAGTNAKTLKDLHDKLTSLETEIKAIKDTAGIKKINDTVDVQLTGSIPEYNWFTTDGRPTPKEPTKPAIGVEVDADTMEITGLLWNGQEWEAR